MLKQLVIRNYAIIDYLEFVPDKHLNIITGETGAGKSIILGALSLILGDRADTSVLINKEEKCVVEAHFDIAGNESFKERLRINELDEDVGDTCIIRREIGISGKSRAFVNDIPVTINVLSALTGLLVDLHQQFGHLALKEDTFQLQVLDAVAHNAPILTSYKDVFSRYRKVQQTLHELQHQQSQWQKEAEYKQFLLDELLNAAFKENEVEDAILQLRTLSNAERILQVLQSASILLEEGEMPLVPELKRVNQQIQTITALFPPAEPIVSRLNSTYEELRDIASELSSLQSQVSMDGELMQQLQERMDLGYKLFKKHSVDTTQDLLAVQTGLEQDLQGSLNIQDRIEKLQQEVQHLSQQLASIGNELSTRRKDAASSISTQVTDLLALVGMPNARFRIDMVKADSPNASGFDLPSFLLDANKSSHFQPLYKAASGGEMSRIMLAIKSLTAQAVALPTLIFDEVDTGISGEAARQVGILLQQLAQYHQVICITHQPQVAAKASRHYFVYKGEDATGRINTKMRILNQEEQVNAIAQMIWGENPSESALQNARELMA